MKKCQYFLFATLYSYGLFSTQPGPIAGDDRPEKNYVAMDFSIHDESTKETVDLFTPVTEEIITNPFREDGFGGQFQSIVATAVYAELIGKKFTYTPFTRLEHNYDNDASFVEKKEILINFINNFDVNCSPDTPRVSVGGVYNFIEGNMQAFEDSYTLKKIRGVFRANKDKRSCFDSRYINVAVHMRRPNKHDIRIEGSDVPDDVYLENIRWIRNIYESQDVLFHIYSQGDIIEFEELFHSFDNVVLHINESIEDTFTDMVLADVLVTAPSSLSYVAGMLSEGIVYYYPFWHQPMPSWIRLPVADYR